MRYEIDVLITTRHAVSIEAESADEAHRIAQEFDPHDHADTILQVLEVEVSRGILEQEFVREASLLYERSRSQ